jgi:dolichyl-phosphate beta-glucosyltransferase
MQKPYLSVIIPAYNEAVRIENTLRSLQEYFSNQSYKVELFIVDDGSFDDTVKLSSKFKDGILKLKILKNECNKGKGYSIKRGVMEAEGKIICFMDADYKITINEIEKIIPYFSQGYEVVIGSRALHGSIIKIAQPFHRRLGGKLMHIIVRGSVSLNNIQDTQCGFKFFSKKAALEIFRKQKIDGYMFDVEILCIAQKLGYKIKEVPIEWMNDPDSRLKLLRDSTRSVFDLWRIRKSLSGNF